MNEFRTESSDQNDKFNLDIGISIVEKFQIFSKLWRHFGFVLDHRYHFNPVGMLVLLDIQHGTIEVG